MPSPRVWKNEVWEVGVKKPSARVTDEDGTVLVQGDFNTNAALKVFNISSSDPDNVVFQTNRAISSIIFNSLQSWDVDGTGYNFQDSLGTNEVTLEGGQTFRLCYFLPHTSLGTVVVVFEWRVRTLLSE